MCNNISNCLINVAKICDCIPFVSTITNAITIVAKIALAIFSRCFSSIKDNAFAQYLMDKSICVSLMLCIPVLNIFVAAIYYLPSRASDDGESDAGSPVVAPAASPLEQAIQKMQQQAAAQSAQILQQDRLIRQQVTSNTANSMQQATVQTNNRIQKMQKEIDEATKEMNAETDSAKKEKLRILINNGQIAIKSIQSMHNTYLRAVSVVPTLVGAQAVPVSSGQNP